MKPEQNMKPYHKGVDTQVELKQENSNLIPFSIFIFGDPSN